MKNLFKFGLAVAVVGLLSMATVRAANVVLYFRDYRTGNLDTNVIIATPISTNILSNGGVIPTGPPRRITPGANGLSTNYFDIGWYAASNIALSRSPIVFNVYDSSSTVYDYTNLLQSGFNTYVVTTYGTNPAPTYTQVTNALGFLPPTSNQVVAATNGLYGVVTNLLVSYQPASTALSNFQTLGTNFFYPRSNPSNFVTASVTNGYATISYVTNSEYSLASKTSLTNATNTLYLLLGTAAFSNSAVFYPRNGNPSNWVTASITNGYATMTHVTNLVSAVGLACTNFARDVIGLNLSNHVATLSTNATNFTKSVGTAVTNYVLAVSNSLLSSISSAGTFIATTDGKATNTLTVRGNLSVATNINVTNNVTIAGTNFFNYGAVSNSIGAAVSVTAPLFIATNNFQNLSWNGQKALVSSDLLAIEESAVTDVELGYLSGVTAAVQTQISNATNNLYSASNRLENFKLDKTNGVAFTSLTVRGNVNVSTNLVVTNNATVGGYIVASNLTAARALVSGAGQQITNSAVTATELGYVSGVTSAIQSQLDNKPNGTGGFAQNFTIEDASFTGTVEMQDFAGGRVVVSDAIPSLVESPITTNELFQLDNVSGNIQTNLDARLHATNGTAYTALTIVGHAYVRTNLYVNSLTVTNAFTNQNNVYVQGSLLQRTNYTDYETVTNTLTVSNVVAQKLTATVSLGATNTTLTNNTFYKTNTVSGSWAWSVTNYTSVAAGDNTLDPGEHTQIYISGTPGAVFNVNSITGGRAGKTLKLINATDYKMTVVNESGFDATAANRIACFGRSADVVIPTNGCAYVDWNATENRWILTSFTPSELANSAALDFSSTSAQTDADLTISVPGATAGDIVTLGVPAASLISGGIYTAYVASNNYVNVRFSNYSSSSKDPASGTFKVRVNQ